MTLTAVVVGAGLSGLVAARDLRAAGARVTVIDKGRSPGGRLATRRIGDATVDHGAQFFTVRSDDFGAQVDDWLGRGVVREWNRGFVPDGHPRYVGTTGMTAIAKDLARPMTVETSTMVFSIRPSPTAEHRWAVAIDDGTRRPADAVVVTCPLPQSFGLLVESDIDLPERLFRTDYDRTLALLAVLDAPPRVGPTGGVQSPSDVIGFVGDNVHKGVSARAALTVHATPAWSLARWDDDPDSVLAALTAAATEWLGGASIVERQLKRWRFATPTTIWPEPCWVDATGTIVVAGDAFAGPRIEGAYRSGQAAARAVLGR